MTCPVNHDLNQHNLQLEKQAKEEKYNEENPRYFWIIKAYRDAYSYETQGLPYLKWEEYADTEESRDELIADARKSNLRCAVIKRIDMRTYA
jgi:hypothetical protein